MVIKPILGHHIKNDGTAQVKIYIYSDGEKELIATDHYVKPSEWDSDAGKVKKIKLNHDYINNSLTEKIAELERAWLKNRDLRVKELKKVKGEYTPITYYEHYIQLMKDGVILHSKNKTRLSESYIKSFGGGLELLKAFDPKVKFSSFKNEWYNKFVTYLISQEYKHNYITKIIKNLKAVIAHSFGKIHNNSEFKYSVGYEKVFKLKLTVDEVERISNFNLKEYPELIPEQERFQVAYNFLLRFSDTISISEKNILLRDGKHFLNLSTQKTKTPVLIPIRKKVYSILKKNNFKIEGSNSKSNERLKKLAMLAKINDKVLVTEFKDGIKKEVSYSKYQLVETHTTRRSAARHLYDSGLEPEIIMKLGGWKSRQQLFDYIDIDAEYAANKVIDHPFFN
jgi:site-specific recombinase XerD